MNNPRISRYSQPWGLYGPDANGEFICVNDFRSLTPTEDHKTIRSNDNVYLERHLIESDTLSLDEQLTLAVKNFERGLPYQDMVFSGGRSIHLVYQVTPTPTTLDEYRFVRKYLLETLGYDTTAADPNTADPARLTRRPNVWRSNGQHQTLLDRSPESVIHLHQWPRYYRISQQLERALTGVQNKMTSDNTTPDLFAKNYLRKNNIVVAPGQRHLAATRLIGAMNRAGFTQDHVPQAFAAVGLLDKLPDIKNLVNKLPLSPQKENHNND